MPARRAPKFLDDPEAGPPPEHVQLACLREAVSNTSFVGTLFILTGLAAAWVVGSTSRGSSRAYAVAGISTFLIAPGLLYVVAGIFLKRRRHWAWVATTAMTWLLFAAATAVCAITGGSVLYSANAPLAQLIGPAVALACWAGALGVILSCLRKCLPAVRRTGHLERPAFTVLPTARPVLPVTEADDDGASPAS